MDAALILADRILDLLKNSGTNQAEAAAALSAANSVLSTVTEIPLFSQDERLLLPDTTAADTP